MAPVDLAQTQKNVSNRKIIGPDGFGKHVRLRTHAPPAVESVTLSDVLALVLDRLDGIQAEQKRQGEQLTAMVRALDHDRGPRDAADVGLLMAIAEAIGDLTFTSTWLLAHAHTVKPELLEALMACDVTSAREFGALCRRLEGCPRQDVWIERAGDSRHGVLWCVRLTESQSRGA